jgi:PTS system mannose-specific IIB component/fructoselysine and glucoselysine-specific PTS system IIB component
VSIALYRIDDRLIHGQVVVGWGQPLNIGFIVLVDDNVACCDWEQDLYRMGVPPEMEIMFADVQGAIANHGSFVADPRKGILVTSDIATMERLIQGIPSIREVNVGGIHHRAGRSQKLRYVFLAPEEEKHLRALSDSGVKVTARDVPAAREVSINEMLGDAAPQTRTA